MASTKLTSTLEKAKLKKEVPPDLQTILLIDIGETLVEISELQTKILKQMQETTPEGIDVLVFEDTVSPPVEGVDPVKQYPYHPLFRAEVINKGANTVYARINEEKEMPVEAEENIVFEKPKALIKYITLRVEAETTVKILGRY